MVILVMSEVLSDLHLWQELYSDKDGRVTLVGDDIIIWSADMNQTNSESTNFSIFILSLNTGT